MKMGVAPFFAFLFLLPFVASARGVLFMPVSNIVDAERNHLPMGGDSFGLHDLVKVFDDEVSPSEGSPAEFASSCLEMARKLKEASNDQSSINEIDKLASTLCHTVPSDVEAMLIRANEACTICRNLLNSINDLVGDTDKQLLLLVSLIKACEIQTVISQCKQLVFTFGPLVLSGLQMIASKDICYMVHICGDAKNQTELYPSPLHVREYDQSLLIFQSILGDLKF